ncbi:MAG: hypothetical protein KJZ54_10850 [Phycisphaerales bacterium]|nr:hypothetical protein [Phycisphaerales bacterium]
MSKAIFRQVFRASCVADARGRRVPLIGRSATTKPEQWRLHAVLSRSPRARRVGFVAAAIALPVFFVPALLISPASRTILGTPPSFEAWRIGLMILTGATMGGAGPLAMIFVARRLLASEIARFIVGAGACASCDYPLAGVPEAPDGCVVCPECGAAWRRDERGPSP